MPSVLVTRIQRICVTRPCSYNQLSKSNYYHGPSVDSLLAVQYDVPPVIVPNPLTQLNDCEPEDKVCAHRYCVGK